QFFVDISNLFNRRTLNFDGSVDGTDFNNYMRSLHLPESEFYSNIPGDDRPGAYRDYDIEYQPMRAITSIEDFSEGSPPDPGVIYYDRSTTQFIEVSGEGFAQVDGGRLSKVLDDKAYIDMPNQSYLTFLNPRDVFWGIRLQF
ncbi:MAG: hypothetical protein KJO98_14790, partial [Rhodothermia bacterium]|nr:hypothetical protein [Rhodothermia bacterium]